MNFLRSQDKIRQNPADEPIPEELHVLEVNEFLPQIHQWIHLGVIFLLVIFLVAIALTTILQYKITVKVAASIRPMGELRLVQSAMTGTVQKIVAKDNQILTQGEAIAYIDNSRLQTQNSQLQNSIQQSKLQLIQIDAQLSEVDTQMIAQKNLINHTIIAAQAELNANQRNYSDQQTKANVEMTQAEANFKLAKSQLLRLQQEKVLIATVVAAKSALDLAKTQQERLQESTVSGAISRNLFEEKVQEVKSAQAKLEQAKSSAKNLWEEKQQAVQVAQGNLDKAKTAVNPTNAGVTAATERIQQEQAKGKTTLSALQKERETLVQQRLEIQKQLIRTHQELKQAESDLLKSVIRAPIAGTLLQLKLRNPGQIVQSSEAIAQISPFHSSLLIKAYVPAKDISKIKVGQKVQMQVSACPYPDYGTLLGNVKAIAPDALPIGKVDAGITGYEVLIQPKTLSVGRGNHQCYLQSGMEGRADIISQEETLLLFILRKAKLMSNF